MLNGKLKKIITITLASISIIGNVTSTPVQARTFPDVAKNAPITKVIDCNDLTEEMLTTTDIGYVGHFEPIKYDADGNATNL